MQQIVQFEWTSWGYQLKNDADEDGQIPTKLASTLNYQVIKGDFCSGI
jgi:hypothetical protein